MAQWLAPWILNAKDAKAAKGALSPCGAWWQPPERFRLAKVANEPFWCPIKKKPLFSMAQWLDPWILNAKGAKDPKGAVGPFGVCWPPPERFGVAKYGNEPFWCPIKKKRLFSMAQLLDPWIKDAKGAKGPFPG